MQVRQLRSRRSKQQRRLLVLQVILTTSFRSLTKTTRRVATVNRPVFNNIYPLNTPPNAEDDFGFNISVSYSDDVVVSAGVVYQPGRSRAHQARMRQLAEQTDLLAAQKKIAEAELQLLQIQIEDAKQQLSVAIISILIRANDVASDTPFFDLL